MNLVKVTAPHALYALEQCIIGCTGNRIRTGRELIGICVPDLKAHFQMPGQDQSGFYRGLLRLGRDLCSIFGLNTDVVRVVTGSNPGHHYDQQNRKAAPNGFSQPAMRLHTGSTAW